QPECLSSVDPTCVPAKPPCEGEPFDPCVLPPTGPPVWGCCPGPWHTGGTAEIFAVPGVLCHVKSQCSGLLTGKCSSKFARRPQSCCRDALPPESCVNMMDTIVCDGVTCHTECDAQ